LREGERGGLVVVVIDGERRGRRHGKSAHKERLAKKIVGIKVITKPMVLSLSLPFGLF
jgi:hypothetical protein